MIITALNQEEARTQVEATVNKFITDLNDLVPIMEITPFARVTGMLTYRYKRLGNEAWRDGMLVSLASAWTSSTMSVPKVPHDQGLSIDLDEVIVRFCLVLLAALSTIPYAGIEAGMAGSVARASVELAEHAKPDTLPTEVLEHFENAWISGVIDAATVIMETFDASEKSHDEAGTTPTA